MAISEKQVIFRSGTGVPTLAKAPSGSISFNESNGKMYVSTDSTVINVNAGKADSATSATTATTASKLGTNAGSATQPVYFSGGVPVATTYTLSKSVPSNAKFTDTVYSLPVATSSVRGGVKIGYTASGKNYPVQLSNEQMYVNVPWTDTTYSNFKGATASAAGTVGLVPAPAGGKQTSFLRGDGKWVVPTNTDTKVTQGAAITTNSNLAVLLAYNTSATAVTNTVNRASLIYNPSTKIMDNLVLDGGSID